VNANAQNHRLGRFVSGNVALKVVSFERASGRKVFRVEIQHDPLAFVVLEADRLSFVALERELRSGFAHLGRPAEGQRDWRNAQQCYDQKNCDLDLFPVHFLSFTIGGRSTESERSRTSPRNITLPPPKLRRSLGD